MKTLSRIVVLAGPSAGGGRSARPAMAALCGLLTLAACGQGGAERRSDASAATAPARSEAQRMRAIPMAEGRPVWADNRQHTAAENLTYQFDHWGDTVGAKDARDYARKARAFIDHPPARAERKTRGNGDVMIYDAASNTLAIARRDGAPRLYRKPPNGAADWAKAKAEADASPGLGAGAGAGRARRYHAPDVSADRSGD